MCLTVKTNPMYLLFCLTPASLQGPSTLVSIVSFTCYGYAVCRRTKQRFLLQNFLPKSSHKFCNSTPSYTKAYSTCSTTTTPP
ncbi:hypothetical protein DE146DRAFT_668695 [Phaeosphaeria sp. MPI-PUGE-AT-0046c]|nr:hypothetical protein DE146DRAFT_668695 [Phaeosphaeria sp. MPI-PUGE-AT-0046c]